ncbi:MAG: hypothetical protein LBD67_09755 [Candidatus Accumulibacter sp.]|jgi:hypothetical protein|nr:hypothetical protein [Accumulibacter sp.]
MDWKSGWDFDSVFGDNELNEGAVATVSSGSLSGHRLDQLIVFQQEISDSPGGAVV